MSCGCNGPATRMPLFGAGGTRGLGVIGDEDLANISAGVGIGAALLAGAGAAVSGAVVGGLAGGGWTAAGTGALISAGTTSTLYGAGMTIVGFGANRGLVFPGLLALTGGIGMLVVGGKRAHRSIKRGRAVR